MNNLEITERVNSEVNYWKDQQLKNGYKVNISDSATNFIVELINNIENDPSTYWKLNDDYNTFQSLAIARIPDALNYCIYDDFERLPYRRIRRRRFINMIRETGEMNISTWEIWNSLSLILIDFCFIPQKDM